jgi:hypothetical protein
MAKMTPSRGYAAEMGTAFVVSFASAYGLPVSTTHSIVCLGIDLLCPNRTVDQALGRSHQYIILCCMECESSVSLLHLTLGFGQAGRHGG